MIRLVLRLDPIAALRHAPDGRTPDLHATAHAALLGGAEAVRLTLKDEAEALELRRRLDGPLQLDITPEQVEAALKVKPERACVHGATASLDTGALATALEKLAKGGVPSALRLPATEAAVLAAGEAGAVWVDLDTRPLAKAAGEGARLREFLALQKTISTARQLGLRVTVGGGLGAGLLTRLAPLTDIEELHVGFSALARAVFTGLTQAVRDLRQDLAAAPDEPPTSAGD